ncbi:hypothetical protein [Stutzerimonas chloritidismutans]|uniref:Uncharacterized protein n=1 Tax=Stutzerimonas chloritidismutans TaxID=203192 RepID=A0ACC5VF51_STUCH|nr:hypothetical protein [Stutzerimonas chloritidismutans]MBX7271088.1 hypothetical protein [Stutzerimonas chloritidismutans]
MEATCLELRQNVVTSEGTNAYTRRFQATDMSQASIPMTSSYKGVSFEITFHVQMQDGGAESWSYSLRFPAGMSDDNPEEFCCLQWYTDEVVAHAEALNWAYRYINGRLGLNDDSEAVRPSHSAGTGKLPTV